MLVFICFSNKEPFTPPYQLIGGYVIATETCKGNNAQNYWLLDFTVYPNTPQIRDTLMVNGTTYANVLKLKALNPAFKLIGMTVSIMYNTITSNKITTTDCMVTNPVTYALKEMVILNQGEIR